MMDSKIYNFLGLESGRISNFSSGRSGVYKHAYYYTISIYTQIHCESV